MTRWLDLLRAEWLLLGRIRLAMLAALSLSGLPLVVVLVVSLVVRGQQHPGLPLPEMVAVLKTVVVPANALHVGLVLVFSLGYEFTWRTVETAIARGVARPMWLAVKVLAVMLADGVVLLLASSLGVGALAVMYTPGREGYALLPSAVFEMEIGGLLAALVVAGWVSLGTVVARSAMGGLLLGLLGAVADMVLSFANLDIGSQDLKTASAAAYTTYLVTWNAVGVALGAGRLSLGELVARLMAYAAGGLVPALWLFGRQDLN